MIDFPTIAGACVGAYFIGWCVSAGFYAFRRFAWSAT